MLFDLRGRGRRRTVQAIYLMLAVLMGGGLVFFGIGGGTNGGLFDALGGNGNSTSANDIFKKRLDALVVRTQKNPQDAQAWSQLASLRFQTATAEDYDSNTGQYTDKGRTELQQASDAWQRYLALKPAKVDPNVANVMVQAYGQSGLQQYDKAVQALEYYIDAQPESAALYARLAILAHGANQARKATLAQDKALELTPKDQQNNLKQDIQAGQSQLDQAKIQQATQNQPSPSGG
jgi:tetratricopeptide (TPR) repeat protein